MAKLTTTARNDLPSSDFALPGSRAYPIENESHARDALSRAAEFAHGAAAGKIEAAVHRKYPDIDAGK